MRTHDTLNGGAPVRLACYRRDRYNAKRRAQRARDKARTATVRELRAALRAVLPYALSRCEDMDAAACEAERHAACALHSRATRAKARALAKAERRYADKASAAFKKAAALFPGGNF